MARILPVALNNKLSIIKVMPIYFEPMVRNADMTFCRTFLIRCVTRILSGILFCALLRQPVQAVNPPLPESYNLILAWYPSTSPEITSYHLYYGTNSGTYPSSIVVDNVTTVTVFGLLSGVTYYFATTAVNADGQESDFSNEVSYQQKLTGVKIQINRISRRQFMLTVTGPAGQTYNIEATEDFLTWTVIGMVTLDSEGSWNFSDPNAGHFPKRFYRTRKT